MDVDGCVFNGSAWFLSGKTSKRSDSSVLIRYDVESELWISINLPNQFLPRNSHTFTLCNEHIYLLFGATRKEKLNDVWRYDAIADSWTKPDLSGDVVRRRTGHSCVCVGNLLYAFGGETDGGKFLNDLVIIDTTTRVVRCLNNMENAPTPRAFHASVYMGNTNEIAIIGGRTKRGVVGDIYIFAVVTEKWRLEHEAVIDARMSHRSFFWGQWLITIGGDGGKLGCGRTALIDTELWKEGLVRECGNIPFQLSHFAVAQIDSTRLLVFGGLDAANKAPVVTSYMLDLTGGRLERAKSAVIAVPLILQPTVFNRLAVRAPAEATPQHPDPQRPSRSPEPPSLPPEPAKPPEPPSPAAEPSEPPVGQQWLLRAASCPELPAPPPADPSAQSVEPEELATCPKPPDPPRGSTEPPNSPGELLKPASESPDDGVVASAEPARLPIKVASSMEQGLRFGADGSTVDPLLTPRVTMRTPPATELGKPGMARRPGTEAPRVKSCMTDRDSTAAARLAAFEADICGQHGVDLMAYPPTVQSAARMKVKRLWQVAEENAGLEAAIGEHDQPNAQPPDSAALVKVVIRGQNRGSVVRVPPGSKGGRPRRARRKTARERRQTHAQGRTEGGRADRRGDQPGAQARRIKGLARARRRRRLK
jgi:hypothetical protein